MIILIPAIISILLNGFLLGSVCLFGYTLAYLTVLPHTYKLTTFWYGISYFIIIALTLLSFTRGGDYLVRLFRNARLATTDEKAKIRSLIEPIVTDAKIKLPRLQLLISDKKNAHIESFGRTIILARGLLNTCTDQELSAALANKLWHVAKHKSAILSAIVFGAAPLYLVIGFYHIYKTMLMAISRLGGKYGGLGYTIGIFLLLPMLPIIAIYWLGQIFLKFILSTLMRSYEYQADQFVAENGFYLHLVSYLEKVDLISETNHGIFNLNKSYQPSAQQRIDILRQRCVNQPMTSNKFTSHHIISSAATDNVANGNRVTDAT
ncbi:MAG: M48 family metalloprotease [Burkholderiales bacterium]|nr:M48 family metalloprotease [Burkholderiales bacterium]